MLLAINEKAAKFHRIHGKEAEIIFLGSDELISVLSMNPCFTRPLSNENKQQTTLFGMEIIEVNKPSYLNFGYKAECEDTPDYE